MEVPRFLRVDLRGRGGEWGWMPDYDAALKVLFRRTAPRLIELLSGVRIAKWLDVELPKSQNLRMDLLGEDAAGELHHFELQSYNDRGIDLRMGEYMLGTRRLTGQFPRQLVLYVGEAPVNMPEELRGPDVSIRYRVVDVRELDGEALLASPDVGDRVIAVLTRLRDHRDAIRGIVAGIAELPESERHTVVQQLVVLAGLRRLGQIVKEEVAKMPIIIDLMENDIIGPAIRQGEEKGRAEGRVEGVTEGELKTLRRQIVKRFGPIPEWAIAKINRLSPRELESALDRVLDAPSLEELFAG